MKNVVTAFIVLLTSLFANVRVKDIGFFEGIRDNQLVGYGIVVGLNGTGDTLNNSPFTSESLISMLERLGVNTRTYKMDTKNVAAVMVTAKLHAFARQGTHLDVHVSALGNAKSLLGGTLLVTPLHGADGEVYAVAQGAVSASGFSASGKKQSVVKGVPTNGRIPNGGIIEKEVKYDIGKLSKLKLGLLNPDFTTALRVSEKVNEVFGRPIARAVDSARISVDVPQDFNGRVVEFITRVEQLTVQPDTPARVVVDDKEGIVVMGENVQISPVAVSHGSLNINITELESISQPGPFSQGDTQRTEATSLQIDDGSNQKLVYIPRTTTLKDLVDALNAIGVSPRDLISILTSIKAAGALQAELEVI